jgi:hypothetical protein
MPRVAGCGVMPQDGDGVVIGIAKASSTSRGGRCVPQDGVVTGAATTSSTTRLLQRCESVVKWPWVICIEY